MPQAQFSPASESASQAAKNRNEGGVPLHAGEQQVAEAAGVRLGWQASTILIWWIPSIAFVALAWIEFRSPVVVAGLLVFSLLLFFFYASDREVRPASGSRRYVVTDQRLLIGTSATGWRDVPLAEIAATHMEEGIADRLVAYLSRAATIVLELRTPGPKGEPRRLRIGPVRDPRGFRALIEERARDVGASPE